jgi:hypothetical protein
MTHRLWVLLAGLSALGCATPYAKLDGVLAGTAPAPASGTASVTLVHQGETRPATVQASVLKGDSLQTLPEGTALLTLRAGYEVIVEPGTELAIENPSIFVTVGKLIVRTVRHTSEVFRLNTRFVSAAVEGTVFVFEVTRDDVVRLSVLEGAVRVGPHSNGWAAVTYQAGQVVAFHGGAPPAPPQPLSPAQTQSVLQRLQEVERAAQYPAGEPWSRFKPLWQKPVFYVPVVLVAAGATAAAIVLTGSGSQDGTVTVQVPLCPPGSC